MPSVYLFDVLPWIFSVISVKLFHSADDFSSVIWIVKFTSHLMGDMLRACRLVLMLDVGGILIALSALLSMSLWSKFINLAQIHWEPMWWSLLWLFVSINGIVNITEVISVLSILGCTNFHNSYSLIYFGRIWFPIIWNIASPLTYRAYNAIWIYRVCAGLVRMRLVS